MKSRMFNKRILIPSAAFAVVAAVTVLILLLPHDRSQKAVATVGDDVITRAELGMRMNQYRSETVLYFHNNHQVEESKKFWKTKYSGEIPIEMLKEKALEQCVKIKLEQRLMLKYGIVKDISFQTFLKELNTENKSRAESIKKGEKIYGPEEYGKSEYFTYIHNNRIIELKKAIYNAQADKSDATDAFTDTLLNEAYEKEKAEVKVKKVSSEWERIDSPDDC